MEQSIDVVGVKELNDNILKLIKSVDNEKVEPILLKASDKIANAVRNLAPLGPTGNLKKSIVSKTMSQQRGNKPRPAFVAIDYKKGPHAHLLEYGTVKMSPHPFFRPGWDANKRQVEEDIKKELLEAIDKAVPNVN